MTHTIPYPDWQASLDEPAREFLESARKRVAEEGADAIPVLLPALPRKIGRLSAAAGLAVVRGRVWDWGAWRNCDLAALELIEEAEISDAMRVDLFLHGDMEERVMTMRTLAPAPVTDATVELLGEAQRTNTVPHFEAAICDSNLLVRALEHPSFGIEDFNRMILKLAFIGLPLSRVLEVCDHANEDLSRMLQDLATEREAAGRAVWPDTNRLIARAPAPGTLARLIGGLEHGDDQQRLAAAEGIAAMPPRPELAELARERLEREPRSEIRIALERIASL
ncbi:MAG: EboA domain-containing protein [Planctomycetota bacterium]